MRTEGQYDTLCLWSVQRKGPHAGIFGWTINEEVPIPKIIGTENIQEIKESTFLLFGD